MPSRVSAISALRRIEAGEVTSGLALLRAQRENPRAALLLGSLQNRPADALRVPLTELGDNVELLLHRAACAWRVGATQALMDSVALLRGLAGAAPAARLQELESLAALCESVFPGTLRTVVSDAPSSAAFDPALRLPVIEATLGTGNARLVVDSGAELTTLDATAAAHLGVTGVVGAVIFGNAGAARGQLGILPDLTVLGRRQRNVPVLVADLRPLATHLGPIAGLFSPADSWPDQAVRLDYRRGSMSRVPSSSAGLPLVFIQGRAIVGLEASVEGGPPGLFAIDSGGRRSALTRKYAAQLSKVGAASFGDMENVTVDAVGSTLRERQYLEHARLCVRGLERCFELERLTIDTTPADVESGRAGKLGSDVFENRVVVLDLAGCRLRID